MTLVYSETTVLSSIILSSLFHLIQALSWYHLFENSVTNIPLGSVSTKFLYGYKNFNMRTERLFLGNETSVNILTISSFFIPLSFLLFTKWRIEKSCLFQEEETLEFTIIKRWFLLENAQRRSSSNLRSYPLI